MDNWTQTETFRTSTILESLCYYTKYLYRQLQYEHTCCFSRSKLCKFDWSEDAVSLI